MAKFSKKLSSQVGIPAFKFKFTVSLEYLQVYLKNEWRPKRLQLTWSRGQRQREFVVEKELMRTSKKMKDDVELDVAEITWETPLTASLLITLYKGSEAADFRSKQYVFALEDNLGLTRRKLAVFPLDISEYASLDSESHHLEMEFKPLSKKVSAVTADLQIYSEFVKKGESRDDDMISNFSHISDDEEFRRMTVVLDENVNLGFEFTCPLQQQQHSNVGILRNRAAQTKSQLLLDLNIAEKSSLTIMRDSDGATGPRPAQKDQEEKLSCETTSKTSKQADHNVAMRLLTKNGSPTLRRPSADVRKRVSALYDDEADKKVDRKTSSRGNIFTNFKSGVRAVFQGRKDILSPTSPDSHFDYPPVPPQTGRITTTRHGSLLNNTEDHEEYRTLNLKILELEEKNQELCLSCGNLEKENASLRRDTEELQSEVGELQLLVEDLRNRLSKANSSNRNSQVEQNKIFEQMNTSRVNKRALKTRPREKKQVLATKSVFYMFKSIKPELKQTTNVIGLLLVKIKHSSQYSLLFMNF